MRGRRERAREHLPQELLTVVWYILAIVAEGTKMGDYLTRWINDSTGMEARLTVLGHVQRYELDQPV